MVKYSFLYVISTEGSRKKKKEKKKKKEREGESHSAVHMAKWQTRSVTRGDGAERYERLRRKRRRKGGKTLCVYLKWQAACVFSHVAKELGDLF